MVRSSTKSSRPSSCRGSSAASFIPQITRVGTFTFPKVKVPTLVIWGMNDAALLPLQLEGLEDLVDDLTIERLPDAGHFAPWEAGHQVATLLQPFLAACADATAPAA